MMTQRTAIFGGLGTALVLGGFPAVGDGRNLLAPVEQAGNAQALGELAMGCGVGQLASAPADWQDAFRDQRIAYAARFGTVANTQIPNVGADCARAVIDAWLYSVNVAQKLNPLAFGFERETGGGGLYGFTDELYLRMVMNPWGGGETPRPQLDLYEAINRVMSVRKLIGATAVQRDTLASVWDSLQTLSIRLQSAGIKFPSAVGEASDELLDTLKNPLSYLERVWDIVKHGGWLAIDFLLGMIVGPIGGALLIAAALWEAV